jgi:MerR family transcriptional regulator, light-induced transcriptional regulator
MRVFAGQFYLKRINMHQFSIRDIENLSGIKAHTLRIWEQRYGLTLCKRKESMHRFYDNDDLKQILRIAYLYKKGYKISRIAHLKKEQIVDLASQQNSRPDAAIFVNQLIEAGMDFDHDHFEEIAQNAIENIGMEGFILNVAYPFMEKIGVLWMTNHVIPAQEHFSSALVIKKLIAAIDALPAVVKKPGASFVLFTPEGEEHELSLLFAQYLLKKYGCHVTLLGKNISLTTLQYYCNRKPVTYLYFHLITNFTNQTIDQYTHQLARTFSQHTIIASGPGVQQLENMPANVIALKSLEEMLVFIRKQ